MKSYERGWIRSTLKNGISERSKDDVVRYVADFYEFESYIKNLNLYLYLNESHYILSTSSVALLC
jgi:hypothetical protein